MVNKVSIDEMPNVEIGESLVGADVERILPVEAIHFERTGVQRTAIRIAGKDGVTLAESLVQRCLEGVIAGVNVVLIVQDALEIRSVEAPGIDVGGGGAGAEDGGIGLGAHGEFGAFGGNIGERRGEAGGDFALDVEVPLLKIRRGEVRVDGQADGDRQAEAVAGAFVRGDGRRVGKGIRNPAIGI